jgi:hypothetical protein
MDSQRLHRNPGFLTKETSSARQSMDFHGKVTQRQTLACVTL